VGDHGVDAVGLGRVVSEQGAGQLQGVLQVGGDGGRDGEGDALVVGIHGGIQGRVGGLRTRGDHGVDPGRGFLVGTTHQVRRQRGGGFGGETLGELVDDREGQRGEGRMRDAQRARRRRRKRRAWIPSALRA